MERWRWSKRRRERTSSKGGFGGMSSHKVVNFALFFICRGPAAHQHRRRHPRPPPQLSSPRRGGRVHAWPPTTLCRLQDGDWIERKLRCQRHAGHQDEQSCCSDVRLHPRHHRKAAIYPLYAVRGARAGPITSSLCSPKGSRRLCVDL
jgi:hypothetical protein